MSLNDFDAVLKQDLVPTLARTTLVRPMKLRLSALVLQFVNMILTHTLAIFGTNLSPFEDTSVEQRDKRERVGDEAVDPLHPGSSI